MLLDEGCDRFSLAHVVQTGVRKNLPTGAITKDRDSLCPRWFRADPLVWFGFAWHFSLSRASALSKRNLRNWVSRFPNVCRVSEAHVSSGLCFLGPHVAEPASARALLQYVCVAGSIPLQLHELVSIWMSAAQRKEAHSSTPQLPHKGPLGPR